MNDLQRHLAPLSDAAWKAVEDEARRVLALHLAARKLVDFTGPLGWEHPAVATGAVESIDSASPDVRTRLRKVLPLMELRVPFLLPRASLDAIDRGGEGDLGSVLKAAKAAARFEDHAVFHGHAGAGITGIAQATEVRALRLSDDYLAYPHRVAEALHTLRTAGIDGPYAIALGPRCFNGLHRTFTSGGFPVIENVTRQLDGPAVWAPAVDGAIVMSMRGGDFELFVGRDFSIGYQGHDERSVTLYLEASFTFRIRDEHAAIAMLYAA